MPPRDSIGNRAGIGNASRTMGIIATVGAVIGYLIIPPLLFVALVLGVLAIIFAFIGRRRIQAGEADNRSAVKVGLVTGIIGTAISFIVLAISVVFLVKYGAEYQRCLDANHDATYCQSHHGDFRQH